MVGKISEVTSFKDGLPRFLLKHSECVNTRFIKESYLPIKNTSPLHRPNAKLPKALTGKKLKHVSCPIQSVPKRLWYACPKCHRLRNFLDDRDQFILYGVTRLWPTPPPAPPTFSSPEVGDSNSADSLEGTYNICRIFHTSSAKLHPRSSQRKLNVITPSPAVNRKSPVRNKSRPKRKNRSPVIVNTSPCSSNANNTSADLVQMVDLLRGYVSPRDHFILKRSMSSSSNVTKIVTEKTTISKTENAAKTVPLTQNSVGTSMPSSPKTQRTVVRRFTKRKSVTTTSSHSTCLSRSNAHQTISPTKLESWTKRLRNGVYIKKTDSSNSEKGRSQTNTTSGNSTGRKKKNTKRKRKSMKAASSVAKSTDASRKNSTGSPKVDVCETSSCKDSINSKSGRSSPTTGLWPLGGESLMNAVISASRTESFKKRNRLRAKQRARSFSGRHTPASTEMQEKTRISTKVTAHIEAVKIGDETVITPQRKPSKRLQMKKSTGSVNLLEKNRTPETNSTPEEGKAASVGSSTSSYSPRNVSDPVALLEDFKNRMKKCQGKGFIKASHIEVIAFLEGKKSDTKMLTLPKTYQQMGLAPLTRSASSENCTQFLNFKCALSDTEIAPKLVLPGQGRKRKKRKKRKSKSTPSSPRRRSVGENAMKGKTDGENVMKEKSDGENAMKGRGETKSASRQVRKSASSGKQKSRGHQQHAMMAAASTAFRATTPSPVK